MCLTVAAVRSLSDSSPGDPRLSVLSYQRTAIWLMSRIREISSWGHCIVRQLHLWNKWSNVCSFRGSNSMLLTCKRKGKITTSSSVFEATKLPQHRPLQDSSPVFCLRWIFGPLAFAKLTFAWHCSSLASCLSASSCRLQTRLLFIFPPSPVPLVSLPCFSSIFMLPRPSHSLLLTESSRLWKPAMCRGRVCACISSGTFWHEATKEQLPQ